MRNPISPLLVSAACLMLLNFASAQKAAPASGSAQASSPHTAPAGASEGLQTLTKALAGKWSVSTKFGPSSEMPNGFSGEGEETWRSSPGGITLLEEETLPTPMGNIFLLGVIWWNGQTKQLQGMECNSQLPFTCDLKGGLNDITLSWDGRTFTILEVETSKDGKKRLWRESWSDITPNSFTQIGETGDVNGSSFKRLLTMHGRKLPD